jgi:streptogramin lyase
MSKKIIRLLVISLIILIGLPLIIFTYNYYTSFKNKAILGINTLAISDPETYIPNNYKNIGYPTDLTVLPDGTFWYADEINNRIVKVDQGWNVIRTVGRTGVEDGEFNSGVGGITSDADGNIYVQTGGTTYKLDFNGGFIASWNLGYSNARFIKYDAFSNALYIGDRDNRRIVKSSLTGELLSTFGTADPGDYQFQSIHDIATDSNGNVYVVDADLCMVKKFNSSGVYQLSFGSCGTGEGQLLVPIGVVVKPNGEIAVASAHSHSIQEYTSDGTWVRAWGVVGSDPGEINIPYSIGIDNDGNYIISDTYLIAIQKFNSNREYVSGMMNSGFTAGRLTSPTSVAYDSVGNLYVMDNCGSLGRVQKFTNGGAYISTIISPPTFGYESCIMVIKNDEIYVSDHETVRKFSLDGTLLLTIGSYGTGDGQFSGARGVSVDSAGNIYVADNGNHRIQKFNSAGEYVGQWGSLGTATGQFAALSGNLITDNSDNIYVSDNPFYVTEPEFQSWDNSRIQVFDTNGTYLRTIGGRWTGGNYDGVFLQSTGMVFDSEGNLHVISWYNNLQEARVQVFDPITGNFIRSYGSGGSGVEETHWAEGIALNPITNNFAIADTVNHRIHLTLTGTRIYNLITSADVLSTTDDASLVSRYYDPNSPGTDNLSSRLYFGDYVVSDFTVDLTEDRNWAEVNTIILPNDSKSLIVNLNPTSAPGVSNTHSIYLVKQAGQTYVHICPNAISMDEVTMDCAGGYTLTDGVDSELSTVTIDGIEYWRITGLTGTGALSPTIVPTNTPAPTATNTPIVTNTPTNTVVPTTVTPTATATVTPTPVEVSCAVDSNQAKCTVSINDVILNKKNDTTVEICWNTNIETKGSIRYGVASTQIYSLTTTLEETYTINNHCATISQLTINTKYIYRILAVSASGQFSTHDAEFTTGIDKLPDTGGDVVVVKDCITVDQNAYTFNKNNEAVLSYKSNTNSECSVSYGNSSAVQTEKTLVTTGTSHVANLNLLGLNSTLDLYFQINCKALNTTTASTCKYNGVIPSKIYAQYATANGDLLASSVKYVQEFFKNPETASTTMVNTAVAGTATTAVISTLAYPQWLSYGFLWLSGRKKNKPWGLVYDSQNLKPVAFAVVRIYDSVTGSQVKQTITDTKGRFGFILDKGEYTLKIEQDNFMPYEKDLSVTKDEETISLDTPLERMSENSGMKNFQVKLQSAYTTISLFLTVIGIVFTIVSLILNPNIINGIVLGVYLVQGIILFMVKPPRNWGSVQDSISGERITGAFVRLFDIEEGRQIDVQLADEKGRFGFMTKDKDYYLKVNAKGYRFPSTMEANEVVTLKGESFVKVNSKDGIKDDILLDPV